MRSEQRAECLRERERRLLADPQASLDSIRTTVWERCAVANDLTADAGLSTIDECRVVVPRQAAKKART